MRNRSVVVRSTALVVAALVGTFALGGPGRGRTPHAEAPMQVASEGPTAEEHLQLQAELGRWLLGELPSGAERAATRVVLTPEEAAAIDRAPRQSVPLKIGLVKGLAPSIEIFGLAPTSSGRLPSRGPTAPAEPTSDGGYVWATVVAADNAGAIRLHVEDMSLPSNAALYVYSREGMAYGPWTGTGPNDSGEFWTTTIFGSEAILQLRVTGPASAQDLGGISFRVQEVGLITPRFVGSVTEALRAPPAPGWPCGNAACIVDASCVSTNLKLAEAKMEWIAGAFIYTCSGGLISDDNPSQNNFFLTANHCLSKNNNAQNVNFYWRFATSSCNGSSCPSNSGWPYVSSGSTVSKTGRKGDFTLLHLNTNPPAGSVFLGWTSAPVHNSAGTQLYRVSSPDFGPQVYSEHAVNTSKPACTGWPRGERIYSDDITGATDGGSSGAPVTNGSLQIVGQLSGACGFNPNNVCAGGPGEDNATVDGAFAFYFSQVQPILDP